MSSVEEQYRLWKDYSVKKEPEVREMLILEYLHLVKYIAGRMNIYFASNIEYDDLVSYGVFGLIDAIDKFDINKGVKFETYASLRIRGAIIDSVRELDWVPRTLRQKNKEVERIYTELELEKGRAPTDEEVAAKMNISIQEYNKLINQINLGSLVSLDEFIEQNVRIEKEILSDSSKDSPEYSLELTELKDILGEAIDKLPEKEKLVISLYYFEELTLKEISLIMKVSESRISQLHSKAIMRLKDKISKYIQK
ncbi:MAG: FliA/WhiG family RNA polymerase sigma factor [Clostridiaceae bacterium]|jgi:RNA polymerase sigma factor for flagellar operon FliA|nr:FliA/WhiG family RNA polymerase sigma factor [Clostridiaceae bacterium]